MSDEGANSGNGDVLSSIRRLVSDEGTLRSAPAKEDDDGSRLVLTQALRVPPQDEEEPQAEEGSAEEEDATPVLPPLTQSLGALEATIAELEAAVEERSEFEPDGGEGGSVLENPPSLPRDFRILADQPVPAPRRRLTLGLGGSASPAEGDGDGDASSDDPPNPPPPAEARPETTAGMLRLVSPVNDDAVSGAEPGPEPEDEDFEDDIAAAAAPASADDHDMLEDPDVEEILLDEDMLRDMVVQIVREELRGSLGEQITANIRKLIRREIHDYFDVRDTE